ncbi:MAG TPA: phosphate ABC transporter permease PstA [Mycobacteriales bacterium]|nr:phosphate ABC transporter permease PstA [Mycobacteriales bacterium]
MSTLTADARIRRAALPRWALAASIVVTFGVVAALFAATPLAGRADYIVTAAVASMAVLGAVSWAREGRRRAMDRLAASGISLALLLMLLPLVFTIGYTIKRGLDRISWSFLTHSMSGIGPLSPGGGVYHAIIGTVEQVGIASVISVPLGLLVAIYVTEYGTGWLAFGVRFIVDVMTGIPSIVAGLFVLSFWVLALNQGFSGFAGSLALAIIELPIVVRSAEEMIRLVPRQLREASYALGVPKWKTIVRIVLPTASTGIVTGAMLAIARVTGETAPVLLVIGNSDFVNNNPFSGTQSSLATYIFQGAGSSSDFNVARAWGAALTLIAIVVILYAAARLLTRRNGLVGR